MPQLNYIVSVSRTCHNSTTSTWTECTESCGIGLSTRATHSSVGCQKPSSLRLCQNRQCAIRQLPPEAGIDATAQSVAGGQWRFNPNAVVDVHKVRVSCVCVQRSVLAAINYACIVSVTYIYVDGMHSSEFN